MRCVGALLGAALCRCEGGQLGRKLRRDVEVELGCREGFGGFGRGRLGGRVLGFGKRMEEERQLFVGGQHKCGEVGKGRRLGEHGVGHGGFGR